MRSKQMQPEMSSSISSVTGPSIDRHTLVKGEIPVPLALVTPQFQLTDRKGTHLSVLKGRFKIFYDLSTERKAGFGRPVFRSTG